MKNITIILILVVIALSVFLFFQIKENRELKLAKAFEKKELVRIIRDSITDSFSETVGKYKDSLDLLKFQKQEIQYVKYEKKIYVDRTFYDALLILSDYEYDKSRKGTSQ